jgi:hypothetical protein
MEDRARQEQRDANGEKGDRRHVPRDVDHRLGHPGATEGTGRQQSERELSHHEDLASHPVHGRAEKGERSGDDQRNVLHTDRYGARCMDALAAPRR